MAVSNPETGDVVDGIVTARLTILEYKVHVDLDVGNNRVAIVAD